MMQWFVALSVVCFTGHHVVQADEFTTNGCFTGSYATNLSHISSGASKVPIDYTRTYVFDDFVFACDGSIQNFNLFASAAGTFLALVFRPHRDERKIHLVAFNTITVETAGAQNYVIPLEEQIDVNVGDVLGLAFPYGEVLSMGDFVTSSQTSRLSAVDLLDGIPSNIQESQNFEKDFPASISFPRYTASITAFVQTATQYLRLSGSELHVGVAEMLKEGEWGRLCDTWHHPKGWPNIFCKALGFPESQHARYVYQSEIDANANLFMKNLRCKASETKVLFNCDLLPYDKCDPSLQVVVECKRRVRLNGNDQPCTGVSQIWRYGAWHTICDSLHDPDWHLSHLDVSWTKAFCRELGCPYENLEVSYANNHISNYGSHLNPKYPNPACNIDNPTSILECPKHSGQTCDDNHDFYLNCA